MSKPKHPYQPPRWPDKLLEWFCAPHLLEEVMGDLHERFYLRVQRIGEAKARRQYWREMLAYMRPDILRHKKNKYTVIINMDMLKNYFKVAFRNLLGKKFYSIINVLGLAIGLTCCLLIFLYVQHELSYDKFHTQGDRIYRLVTNLITPTETLKAGTTTPPMAATLQADFPEVEKIVRLYNTNFLLEKGDLRFQEDNALMVDSAFFEVFDFKLLQGSPHTALVTPFSIVLTEDVAQKYFGSENPIGQRLRMDGKYDMTVTGVVQNVPENSHITFDVLVSLSTLLDKLQPERKGAWANFSYISYLLLAEHADYKTLESKFPAFLEKYIGKLMDENKMHFTLFLEPLQDVYLHSDRYAAKKGSLTNIYIFSIIAGFILIIACINFMNLTTARATERAKEVGIRKVIGAVKRQLILQFLCESMLLSLGAFVLALLFSELLIPVFNQLSGKLIANSLFDSSANLFTFFLVSIAIGLLAGIYPALVLSNFRPTTILKGRFSSSQKGLLLRKGLVVVQFIISIMLIAGTVIVYLQLDFMQNQKLGFQKDQMLIIDFRGDEAIQKNIETIKHQLKEIPEVLSASASFSLPSKSNYDAYTTIENPDGEMQEAVMSLTYIDYDFIDQYKISLAAGRNFSPEFSTDSTQALIINEAAASKLGYTSPEEAVGKRFSQWGKEGQIIGVVKNYHFYGLQQEINPLTFNLSPEDSRFISLHLQSQQMAETISKIEQQWQHIAPERPFNYFFLDESFDQQYRAETRFEKLFTYFAGLAIFIACLGLLGLISYTVVQRTKEIGIRKVLGATESSIVKLLSKDFLILILMAIIIATPIAWICLKQWLSNFAYRVEVQWWVFALSGGLAVVIALFAISFQTMKAAWMNPVDSLRNE